MWSYKAPSLHSLFHILFDKNYATEKYFGFALKSLPVGIRFVFVPEFDCFMPFKDFRLLMLRVNAAICEIPLTTRRRGCLIAWLVMRLNKLPLQH